MASRYELHPLVFSMFERIGMDRATEAMEAISTAQEDYRNGDLDKTKAREGIIENMLRLHGMTMVDHDRKYAEDWVSAKHHARLVGRNAVAHQSADAYLLDHGARIGTEIATSTVLRRISS